MKVTIGGDRLGSGQKMKTALNEYARSTHNLTQKFTSSMQCGTLYPFLVMPAMRGDKFNIKLEADARTIPTKGPLFGSFKMQVDLFQCDVRLYQAILHNNPLAIGLKMGQVKFPLLEILDNRETREFSNNSLLKYLGMSGIGTNITIGGDISSRRINAIPALAYYEIFKTYYSNKQEENAYIIATNSGTTDLNGVEMFIKPVSGGLIGEYSIIKFSEVTAALEDASTFAPYDATGTDIYPNTDPMFKQVHDGWEKEVVLTFTHTDENNNVEVIFSSTIADMLKSQSRLVGNYNVQWSIEEITKNKYRIKGVNKHDTLANGLIVSTRPDNDAGTYEYSERGLQSFALANIDDMRLALLSHHQLGVPYIIANDEESTDVWGYDSGTDQTGLPYINLVKLCDASEEKYTKNAEPLNGLLVKTYQSDLFNCWVNTEWIDGENGIANVTAISTASGSIKIDSLNLAEKLYNMLNRIAVSDGSYEGWQDAVYTETPKRHIESPIYLGGLSSEIVFEEIVQSAPTENSALGTLGGKGKLLIRKGGQVTVKTNEAAFIIGIVSLTPRINYTQGNEFYMTDLLSMDDFHKPALDGIGFQDLIAERAAWWDTTLNNGHVSTRGSLGKVPAWLEYMTAVDKAYGDFAAKDGFMSLNRDYERSANNKIADATTYIDPRKYNYAFAYTDIDAQNFWVQIKSTITARRLMSAKQIPNI